MANFGGQVVIITGASGLLASGVIPVFRDAGAQLVLTCGDNRLLERFPELLHDGRHLCLPETDLTNPDSVDMLIAGGARQVRTNRCLGQYRRRLGRRQAGARDEPGNLGDDAACEFYGDILDEPRGHPDHAGTRPGQDHQYRRSAGTALQRKRCCLCGIEGGGTATDREHV